MVCSWDLYIMLSALLCLLQWLLVLGRSRSLFHDNLALCKSRVAWFFLWFLRLQLYPIHNLLHWEVGKAFDAHMLAWQFAQRNSPFRKIATEVWCCIISLSLRSLPFRRAIWWCPSFESLLSESCQGRSSSKQKPDDLGKTVWNKFGNVSSTVS